MKVHINQLWWLEFTKNWVLLYPYNVRTNTLCNIWILIYLYAFIILNKNTLDEKVQGLSEAAIISQKRFDFKLTPRSL